MENKVIFWDFDGTLVKSNQSFLESLRCAMEEAGAQAEDDCLMEFLRFACSWYHPEEGYPEAVGEQWWETLLSKADGFLCGLGIPSAKRREICRAFRENAVNYPYELYEDSVEVLRICREKGYHNYILSNNFPELSHSAAALGLSELLDGCFLSSVLGWEKPRKEIFEQARALAGNPARCFMVGDNPEADIRGAAAAGIPAILVHRDAPAPEAEYIFRNLREIPDIL